MPTDTLTIIPNLEDRFMQAVRADPRVLAAWELHAKVGEDAWRACIVLLYEALIAAESRIIALQAICPRRVRLADGRVYIWHAPDNLVPLEDNHAV